MFKIMKKIALKAIIWLKTSHHWQHLVGGVAIGLFANGWYCTEFAGCGVAFALELKDLLYGNKFDPTDALLTIAGTNIGYLMQRLVFGNL